MYGVFCVSMDHSAARGELYMIVQQNVQNEITEEAVKH